MALALARLEDVGARARRGVRRAEAAVALHALEHGAFLEIEAALADEDEDREALGMHLQPARHRVRVARAIREAEPARKREPRLFRRGLRLVIEVEVRGVRRHLVPGDLGGPAPA